ncbi:hypothetical protein CR492_11520 [Methylocella silvestris]|uniref:Uncharacterized protein n=1 Tax=Methylocella silvestris TaxID=199596 RepID=A0A2J7TG45_METSI|nr:hypothetical protein CR492_11520 [Methylocella silvestris]
MRNCFFAPHKVRANITEEEWKLTQCSTASPWRYSSRGPLPDRQLLLQCRKFEDLLKTIRYLREAGARGGCLTLRPR